MSRVPLGYYVHVPFCSVRCGYCDFNTYTATELGGGGSQAEYADQAIVEIGRARDTLGDREADTVFFGGGTPTQLPADDLVRMLAEIPLRPGGEVTTEANPDSVTPESLARLREGGFTRVSFGMQSAVPHVLSVLERTHDPERVPQAVAWAREAGFEQVSLDLIYGTPGESVDDWRRSLESAVACGPDHVSAYSLIVEEGTALARQVRRGVIPMPDEDDLADKYLLADELLTEAGLGWYEVSNWARDAASRCEHNRIYWLSGDWWGIGPGAHSHVAGRRWWNVKHPRAYAQRLGAGESPEQDFEVVDEPTRRLERVLLEIRLVEGLPRELAPDAPLSGLSGLPGLIADGLVLLGKGPEGERVRLTRTGRLLADAVVRRLLD